MSSTNDECMVTKPVFIDNAGKSLHNSTLQHFSLDLLACCCICATASVAQRLLYSACIGGEDFSVEWCGEQLVPIFSISL